MERAREKKRDFDDKITRPIDQHSVKYKKIKK